MDALPVQKGAAGAVQPILRAAGALAFDPLAAAVIGSPFSFIRPSNVVSLAEWRRKRRAAR